MVNDIEITKWHKAVRDAHKKLGTPADSSALKPYTSGNKTGRFRDLQALTVVESHLVEHGFEQLELVGTGWFTKYGPIVCRVWCDHTDKHLELCVVARGIAEKDDNIEVAEYQVVFKDDRPVLTEVKFDVATLVLPKN